MTVKCRGCGKPLAVRDEGRLSKLCEICQQEREFEMTDIDKDEDEFGDEGNYERIEEDDDDSEF